MSFTPIVRRPIYRQVMERVAALIKEKRPGDRVGTEAEFVKKFGVSVHTVRQALGELERQGLLERRQGSGTYVPERFIPRSHVAVLLDLDLSSGNISPFFIKTVRKIRSALTELGVASRAYYGNLPLGTRPSGLTCGDFIDDVHLGRISGLISFFTRREPSWVDLLQSKQIPFIDPEYRLEREGPERNDEFIRAALSYLKERGRRRIALIVWESNRHPLSDALLRIAPEFDIEIDQRLLNLTANGWEAGMGWERFRDLWYSGSERPDGIIIGDDMLFSDCQKAILELKIDVPKALDLVLRSSDAVDIKPAFPLLNWKSFTAPAAMADAKAMKALLDGTPVPPFEKAHVLEYLQQPQHFEEVASSPLTHPIA